MPFLVRRIAPRNWDGADTLANLSADAITSDLKTSEGGNLSLWEINSEAQIDQAILALVAAPGKKSKIDKIDVVIIDKKRIANAGLAIVPSEGQTLVSSLNNTHCDVQGLKYTTLGTVAEIVIDSLADRKLITRTQAEVIQIIKDACNNGMLDKGRLSKEMQAQLN